MRKKKRNSVKPGVRLIEPVSILVRGSTTEKASEVKERLEKALEQRWLGRQVSVVYSGKTTEKLTGIGLRELGDESKGYNYVLHGKSEDVAAHKGWVKITKPEKPSVVTYGTAGQGRKNFQPLIDHIIRNNRVTGPAPGFRRWRRL